MYVRSSRTATICKNGRKGGRREGMEGKEEKKKGKEGKKERGEGRERKREKERDIVSITRLYGHPEESEETISESCIYLVMQQWKNRIL